MEKIDKIIKYDDRSSTVDNPFGIVKKAVCLVSGGMDSATVLWHTVKNLGADNVKALSIHYGQKGSIELQHAKKECEQLGVERFEMDLSDIFKYNKDYSSYIKGSSKEIESKGYSELIEEKLSKGEAPISPEYIPARNPLLLNVAASIGLQLFNNQKFAIVQGIHADDVMKDSVGNSAPVYPDAVAAGSKIYMVDGSSKNIEDVEIGDAVWGFDENTQKISRSIVVDKIDQGIRPVYQAGPTKVSENHLMWMKGKNFPIFRRYSELKRKDPYYEGWSWDAEPFNVENEEDYINGYLRGFLDGDGYIGSNGYISISQKDKSVLEEWLQLADLTNLALDSSAKGRLRLISRKINGIYECYISREASDLLRRIEYKDSRDYAAGYLNGMIIAEGNYTYNPSSNMGALVFCQSVEVNPQKVDLIDKYLAIVGWHCNTYIDNHHCKNWKFSKAWRIPLKYGAGKLNILRSKMEDHLKVKTLKGIRILGINQQESLGEEHCYDLTTTSGSFISDGLLVHNCSQDFANAYNKMIQYATAGLVYIYTPLANKTKAQVAEFGIANGMTKADFKNTWSCYSGATHYDAKEGENDSKIEGSYLCATCQDKLRALVKGANYTVEDILSQFDVPREYAELKYKEYKGV